MHIFTHNVASGRADVVTFCWSSLTAASSSPISKRAPINAIQSHHGAAGFEAYVCLSLGTISLFSIIHQLDYRDFRRQMHSRLVGTYLYIDIMMTCRGRSIHSSTDNRRKVHFAACAIVLLKPLSFKHVPLYLSRSDRSSIGTRLKCQPGKEPMSLQSHTNQCRSDRLLASSFSR